MDLECHLYDYFRVLSTTASTPLEREIYVKSVNWRAVFKSWTAPIAVQLLRPEQTRGGVTAHSGGISVDLTHGLAVRNARRRAGEIGRAACALMSHGLGEQNGDKIFERQRPPVATI
jgi:hypothetical protein